MTNQTFHNLPLFDNELVTELSQKLDYIDDDSRDILSTWMHFALGGAPDFEFTSKRWEYENYLKHVK